MFMYVGHDSTVGALLDGLNIWNMQIPVYSQMVMIELHEDTCSVGIVLCNGGVFRAR